MIPPAILQTLAQRSMGGGQGQPGMPGAPGGQDPRAAWQAKMQQLMGALSSGGIGGGGQHLPGAGAPMGAPMGGPFAGGGNQGQFGPHGARPPTRNMNAGDNTDLARQGPRETAISSAGGDES